MSLGRIIIISGPSGSGKTTLYKKLLSSPVKKNLVKSVSMTTRPRRKNERSGRDYLFIEKKEFLSNIENGHFLEWQKVFDAYYGTPKAQVWQLLKKGKNVLLCIDVKGAEIISKEFPEAVKIFVKTPNLKILEERLINRKTETKEELKTRLNTARDELKQAKYYQYILINNTLTEAARELQRIIKDVLNKTSNT